MAWGTKGSGPGQFSYPRGLAANSSEVVVADDDNHRIEKFDPAGAFQAVAGSQGSDPGQFAFPYGVSLDVAGTNSLSGGAHPPHREVALPGRWPRARLLGTGGHLH